jgi:hypothetical protein
MDLRDILLVHIFQFRALSDQLYRSPEHHAVVREQIIQQVGCIWMFTYLWCKYFNIRRAIIFLCWCHQLKSHPEMYEGYVPMAYNDYLKKISKYCAIPCFHGISFVKSFIKIFFMLICLLCWVHEIGMANGVIMWHCRLLQIG